MGGLLCIDCLFLVRIIFTRFPFRLLLSPILNQLLDTSNYIRSPFLEALEINLFDELWEKLLYMVPVFRSRACRICADPTLVSACIERQDGFQAVVVHDLEIIFIPRSFQD
jgi:hypothetical protein